MFLAAFAHPMPLATASNNPAVLVNSLKVVVPILKPVANFNTNKSAKM